MDSSAKPKKLIEVAMPIKEVSSASVRDKSIRHGHISTLHLWWARRPLPVSRAVVFASLMPDPLDPHCPPQVVHAIDILLKGAQYRPYADIPHTAAVDPMEDNPRNRLLMFIGKYTDEYINNEKVGQNTPAKDTLSKFSLIDWEGRQDTYQAITIARTLIFVAHNAHTGLTAPELIAQYESLSANAVHAHAALYRHVDRHLDTPQVQELKQRADEAQQALLQRMPKVFDPFAGGGAIPLEAARLGCRTYGNDINPVAHIIQRASCEFPQRFGKPIHLSQEAFIDVYGHAAWEEIYRAGQVFSNVAEIPNRLAFDVSHYAHLILDRAKAKIGHYYPSDAQGNKPIAYYWARVGTCANPSCGAQVPLLKQFYLSKKSGKHIYLNPIIQDTDISFEIIEGIHDLEVDGWVKRGNLTCPCCNNVTEVKHIKKQFRDNRIKHTLLAIIEDTSGGKRYRLPRIEEEIIDLERKSMVMEKIQVGNKRDLRLDGWGIYSFYDMFTDRQLLAMNTFVEELTTLKQELAPQDRPSPYLQALFTYLAIWIDRIVARMTSFGLWHPGRETLEYPFGRQAIPMVFDYPESNPLTPGAGSPHSQLDWIVRYIREESFDTPATFVNASSGEVSQFQQNELDAVITDPPYYDAIAYADLSDFFYVWLKRTLGDIFPLNFAYPQTPKTEECTALKHHHANSAEAAQQHFENKLLQIFTAIQYQTRGIVSIMFAHQSTQAWTTLCNSILGANMNITGSWPLDTEYSKTGLKKQKDYLASSVTVSCVPMAREGVGDFREVQSLITKSIQQEVRTLYTLGFRGADLLTACFGKAVAVFGQYQLVEKANGDTVTVVELLDMARDAAFNAIVSDIDTDEATRFYIGWLNLFGRQPAIHDEVRRISQIGLSLDMADIYNNYLLIKQGEKAVLATMAERLQQAQSIGQKNNSSHLDRAHRIMYYYQDAASRKDLLQYIAQHASHTEAPVWRVINAIAELMPASKQHQDQKIAAEIMTQQEALIKQSRTRQEALGEQASMFNNY